MLTKERANEIVAQARALTQWGSWSDQLDKVMLPGEREEIIQRWNTMDGSSCFVDALNTFCRGK